MSQTEAGIATARHGNLRYHLKSGSVCTLKETSAAAHGNFRNKLLFISRNAKNLGNLVC